jgi:hypothetical protein
MLLLSITDYGYISDGFPNTSEEIQYGRSLTPSHLNPLRSIMFCDYRHSP